MRKQVKLLVTHKNDIALSKLIRKSDFPVDYLDKIASFSADTWRRSRSEARRHPQLPVSDIIKYLAAWANQAGLKAEQIDAEILRNPSISVDMISPLLNELSQEKKITTAIHILRYPYCPDEVIASAVSQDGSLSPVQVAAAKSPKLSRSQIAKLLNNGTVATQRALVSNPYVPVDYLRELLWSKKEPLSSDADVATLPVPVAQALVKRLDGPDLEEALGWLRVNSASRYSRLLVARYTVSSDKISESCYDPDPAIRRIASRHELATEEDRVAVAILGTSLPSPRH
jgi:hypothetical protein